MEELKVWSLRRCMQGHICSSFPRETICFFSIVVILCLRISICFFFFLIEQLWVAGIFFSEESASSKIISRIYFTFFHLSHYSSIMFVSLVFNLSLHSPLFLSGKFNPLCVRIKSVSSIDLIDLFLEIVCLTQSVKLRQMKGKQSRNEWGSKGSRNTTSP